MAHSEPISSHFGKNETRLRGKIKKNKVIKTSSRKRVESKIWNFIANYPINFKFNYSLQKPRLKRKGVYDSGPVKFAVDHPGCIDNQFQLILCQMIHAHFVIGETGVLSANSLN